jgi:two-component system CitB family response regulator
MADWRALVIDGDRDAAARHCRFIAKQQGFAVVGAGTSAAQAIPLVLNLQPDLLVLDLELADGDGLRLLRRLRASGRSLEVIVTTTRADSEAVRSAFELGVLDYVLKPFYPARLRQSLGLLIRRAALTAAGTPLTQQQIDELRSPGRGPARWLPRDLRADRLEQIRGALRVAHTPLTAEQIAAAVSVARTTARRYLEYLVTIDEARVQTVSLGPGRPFKCYEHHDAGMIGMPAARPAMVAAAAEAAAPAFV